jgi:hypothetical protein
MSGSRDELESYLIGWQLRISEWTGGRAANAIFRELRNGFTYCSSPHGILLEACQRALDSATDSGLPITPQHIATRVCADNPPIREDDLCDFLRSWSLVAPASGTEQELRRQISGTLDLLRDATRADRRRQADEMLRARGIEVFEDVRALLDEDRGLGRGGASVCVSIADWCARELPAPDFLMGELLSSTSRVLLVAPTGLGKTNFALPLAFAMADGTDFLHWRGRGRSARVLFIDGEMSNRQMKRRIEDAVRRYGRKPETLYVFSRHDTTDMPPLNTREGQEFIDGYIQRLGGVDFIWFDNVQALLVGSMIEEEPWQDVLPWVRSLTMRNIGQCWVHHTGHDKTRSYGSSTREWQMDTVALMEAADRPGADIAFRLKFLKARERAPHNRDDFAEVVITLSDDQWQYERADPARSAVRLTAGEAGWLRDLTGIFAEPGAPIQKLSPASGMTQQSCLTRDHIRERLKQKGKFTLDPDENLTGSDRQKMSTALNALKDKGQIGLTHHHVWLMQERQ